MPLYLTAFNGTLMTTQMWHSGGEYGDWRGRHDGDRSVDGEGGDDKGLSCHHVGPISITSGFFHYLIRRQNSAKSRRSPSTRHH